MIFVAEVGMNHNGNFGLFFELIKQAAHSGADIVKFQLGWRDGEGEINRLTKIEISEICRCCSYFSVQPMFSIISESAFEMIQEFDIKEYKIASRTVRDNMALAKRIVNEKKTTYVSLGLWDRAEFPFDGAENVKYLWCKFEYPAHPWNLVDLPKDFRKEGFHGYSDHSVGIEIPLLAITRGAAIIEKHFTLDKSDNTIRDHALSANPEEFRHLVQLGKSMHSNLMLGI